MRDNRTPTRKHIKYKCFWLLDLVKTREAVCYSGKLAANFISFPINEQINFHCLDSRTSVSPIVSAVAPQPFGPCSRLTTINYFFLAAKG